MDMKALRISILALALWAPACTKEKPVAPEPGTLQEKEKDEGSEQTAAEHKKPVALPDEPRAAPAPKVEPSPDDLAAQKEADERRKKRAAKLFGAAIDPLTKASEALQEHDSLDRSKWFGKDQEDNQERINELLDDAIKVLGVSEIDDLRRKIRDLEQENQDLIEGMVEDREERLSAPTKDELGRLQKTYTTSREELDERIAEAEITLKANRRAISEHHIEFVRQMRGIGVDIDLEAAQSLLSTVTGDDFVKMCVVFDNVRGVTVQLQELTEESGESLEAAKRYYGSYVVLIHLLDHVQKDFVRRAREEMIPKLDEFAAKADELITAAHRNMEQGGDPKIGEQNIRSNELTLQATELYTQYLREQASEIEARNQELQISLRDAENTFETVALSSEVAGLLKEGSRNFGALLRLDLPALRGFENEELKAEFRRLTERMSIN